MEGQEAEADALGHVNSILVVGEQEMDELGAGAGTLEGSTVEEEADELRLRKGDFEQTLEVSLNDTPADAHHFNILHSEVSVAKTNIIKTPAIRIIYHRPMLRLGYASTSPMTYLMHLWT